MDEAEIWRHIHAERAALAATPADLPPEDWHRPSLCTGWTVHDVAAHVISTPQIGWGDIVAMAVRSPGSYNRIIYRQVKRLGRRGVQRT